MERTRVTESRMLVYSALRRALDSHGEEPEPPLTGEASEIKSTHKTLKPLLEKVKDYYDAKAYQSVVGASEELVVESLFLLARSMEITEMYSDSGVETPLTAACYFALGSYMEQESQKEDRWRDEDFNELYHHAKSEIGEIRDDINDNEVDNLLRNSVDLVLLVGILYATVLDESNEGTITP